MRKSPKTPGGSKRSSDELRKEYHFDYSKARPNRFAERIGEQSTTRDAGGLGTEIAGLFAKVGLKSDMPELRGHKVKRPSVKK